MRIYFTLIYLKEKHWYLNLLFILISNSYRVSREVLLLLFCFSYVLLCDYMLPLYDFTCILLFYCFIPVLVVFARYVIYLVLILIIYKDVIDRYNFFFYANFVLNVIDRRRPTRKTMFRWKIVIDRLIFSPIFISFF